MPKKQKETTAPPAVAPAAVAVPEQATAVEPPKAKPVDPRTFTLTSTEFTPGKGLAAALHAELKKAPGTAQQLSERLLASGEYQRTAPKAAELRPVKPVETFLKQWLAKGAVQAS